MSQTHYLFMIIGKDDVPLYSTGNLTLQKDSITQMSRFVLHASLDLVEEAIWKTNTMYMKNIDHFEDYNISAFVTAGNETRKDVKLLLLHESRLDDSVKIFFQEVYECYIKILLNPFYEINSPITSEVFDSKVKELAKKSIKPTNH